jgi:hypothetical protein
MAKCLGRIRLTSEVAADTGYFAAVLAFANA